MPIISEQMKKAAKKAEAVAKKKKEEEEHKQREEQAKKEQEEREAKEREEQEKQQKKNEIRQKRKEKVEKHKKEKQELEKRSNMRKEMALIKKGLGAKPITDEVQFERQGFSVTRKEVASAPYSKIYKAKQAGNENLICKVIILEKMPQNYRQNLLDVALRIQRYIGGAAGGAGGSAANDAAASGGGNEPKHPTLVKVFDVFATDKKAYVFEDECQSESLQKKMKSSEPMDENQVKKTMKDVMLCLQYLHSIGVAHLNIRPSSVIFDRNNQLKVVGLDQCCFYWDSDMETVIPKKRLSKNEFPKNNHLPPEAFKAETFDSSLADVWSAGVLMCQLVAKENPFKMKPEPSAEDQWRAFAESKQFSDEAKQLLDRIFVEVSKRPSVVDLLDDPYLKNVS